MERVWILLFAPAVHTDGLFGPEEWQFQGAQNVIQTRLEGRNAGGERNEEYVDGCQC